MRKLNPHDVLDDMCERYFGRILRTELDVSWSYFPSKGSWNECEAAVVFDDDHTATIRLDKHILETPWVPAYYLRALIFHEAAHVFRWEESEDLDAGHSPAFNLLVALYPGHHKAMLWYAKNGDRLRRRLSKVRTQMDESQAAHASAR